MLLFSAKCFAYLREMSGASKKLHLAVAFWGKGAANALGLDVRAADRSATDVKIICNLRTGGTNPDEIVRLMDLGFDVRHSDQLHAKVYRMDEEAILGSANASTNGLGFEGAEAMWSEANVRLSDAKLLADIDQWFEAEWKKAKTVTKLDLEIARRNRQRQQQAKRHFEQSSTENTILCVHDMNGRLRFYDDGTADSGNWWRPATDCAIIRVFDSKNGESIAGGPILSKTVNERGRTIFRFRTDPMQVGRPRPVFLRGGWVKTVE